jgi:hypothetical protein
MEGSSLDGFQNEAAVVIESEIDGPKAVRHGRGKVSGTSEHFPEPDWHGQRARPMKDQHDGVGPRFAVQEIASWVRFNKRSPIVAHHQRWAVNPRAPCPSALTSWPLAPNYRGSTIVFAHSTGRGFRGADLGRRHC